jgi:hypothetical protein
MYPVSQVLPSRQLLASEIYTLNKLGSISKEKHTSLFCSSLDLSLMNTCCALQSLNKFGFASLAACLH